MRDDWPDLPGVPVHALDAPPATAVLAACLGVFGAKPELVASGINPGQNTGHLVLHSGTVGAVREAELAAHGEVWIVSASVAGGDLKLEFEGQGEAAPGTDVATIRDGYVAVTPLVGIARATPRDVRSASEAIDAERAWARLLPDARRNAMT